MSKITRIDNDKAREENADKIERWSKMDQLADELTRIAEFDMSKDEKDEPTEVKVASYTRSARAGLSAILARAAADEAKSRG